MTEFFVRLRVCFLPYSLLHLQMAFAFLFLFSIGNPSLIIFFPSSLLLLLHLSSLTWVLYLFQDSDVLVGMGWEGGIGGFSLSRMPTYLPA